MIRKIAVSVSCILSAAVSYAQVNKQVEVTKAYVPEVSEAMKLPVAPDMADTVKMRPEIDCGITPLMYPTDLATHRFRPATVTYWEFNRPTSFYLKLGAGYPVNTVGDFYASVHDARVGYIAGYANHRGQFGDMKNYFGKWHDALQARTRVGVAGGVYWGKHMFEGDVNYYSSIHNRYAGTDDGPDPKSDFENVSLKLRLGDDFVDLSRVNFDVGVHSNYFNDKSDWQASDLNLQQADFGVDARVARSFDRHYAELSAGYDGYLGIKDLKAYSDHIIRVGARYGYTSNLLKIAVGADYYHDRISTRAKKSNYVIPYAKLSLNISRSDAIVPFVELNGQLRNNSYRALAESNPYVGFFDRELSLPNTVQYKVSFGISGRLAQERLAYRFYADMSFYENSIYWYNYDIIWLRATAARQNIMSLNLELDYKPVNQFAMSLDVHGYLYTDFADVCNGKAPVDGFLKLRYMHRKFSVGVSAAVRGEAAWTSFVHIGDDKLLKEKLTVPFYADLGVEAEWYATEKLSVFLEGSNLANMNMYKWAFYREQGIRFTAGVKFSF